MSWSDPEPTTPPQGVFRAGLSLVGSGEPRKRAANRAEPETITTSPFGQPSGRRATGLGGAPGLGALGQNLGALLEQHFEQFGAPDPTPTEPIGKIRPVIFAPFGGEAHEVDVAETEAELEVVEPAEPLTPPPDYEAIKAEAWNEGFQQGYAEGVRLAQEEQRDTTIRLGALLHDMVADNEGFVRGMETDIVELVLAVAEKVVGREVRTDPQIVVNVVRSALNEIHDATEVRIRAHPDDVVILEPRWQEMLPRRVAERSELAADELVERGGVVVETQIGYVDSQIKTRLQQVVNTFQAVLDGEPV